MERKNNNNSEAMENRSYNHRNRTNLEAMELGLLGETTETQNLGKPENLYKSKIRKQKKKPKEPQDSETTRDASRNEPTST